jgi:signal transduction histidine kinase
VDKNLLQAQHKQQILSFTGQENAIAFVDPGLVREVFENLVSNAIKFSPKGSAIRVKVIQKEQVVQVQVEDQGEGLSKEDMKRMFGKFQRLSAQPTNGESSTGLGLAIVKKLVDLHQGKVWAESKGKGKGCSFFVEIPVASADQLAAYHTQPSTLNNS